MKFLFPLIAALAIFFPIPTYGQLYVGVFYDLALKATLRERFYSTNTLGTADNSSRVPAYDHITLHFKPSQETLTNVYNPRFGEIQTAHVLGYAMDEHGQAILVHVDGPNAIQSTNTFPHVTISSSNSPGYSAVYSNDLWGRVAASGFVSIRNDSYNKPAEIRWNYPNLILEIVFGQAKFINRDRDSCTFQFTLPPYTGEFGTYASTLAQVTLYDPAIGGLLKGTFCGDTKWNRTSGVCDTTV